MASISAPKGHFDFIGDKASLLRLIAQYNGTLLQDNKFCLSLVSAKPRIKLFGFRTGLSIRIYCRFQQVQDGFCIQYSVWPGFRTLAFLACLAFILIGAVFWGEPTPAWPALLLIVGVPAVACFITYQDCMRQLHTIFGGNPR